MRLFQASFVALAIIASCNAPMGPQGEVGPAGPMGPPGNGSGACDAPKKLCGTDCIDPTNDSKNCGACGVTCVDACVSGGCCGDGKKNGNEECDKSDLGMATCATAIGPGWMGNLACAMNCKFDTKGCSTPATTWNDFVNGSNWTVWDTTNISGAARGYQGTLFDGRYVYFVPYYDGGYDGYMVRYDTQAGFVSAGSYQAFDVSSVAGNARGFQHGVFDGRYVYFVPSYNSQLGYHGMIARYDSQKDFTMASSWSVFDATNLFAGARGYVGGIFDGRYVYFVPNYNGSFQDGLVLRYDTQSAFGFSGSWAAFDMATVFGGARGYVGGAFDGRYIYFAPYSNGAISPFVARYDTQAPFGDMASWSVFDLTPVSANARGYQSASFDGRYVYFAPYSNGNAYSGLVTRYDTQAAFNMQASWSTFDVAGINGGARGFQGSVFDGRYVYFCPSYNGGYDGITVRYDTMNPFGMPTSWQVYDANNVGGRGFAGCTFDGRYLYFAQYSNGVTYGGVITRFDAKSASWLPKYWSNSQF